MFMGINVMTIEWSISYFLVFLDEFREFFFLFPYGIVYVFLAVYTDLIFIFFKETSYGSARRCALVPRMQCFDLSHVTVAFLIVS